jgi:DUF1680 family protein
MDYKTIHFPGCDQVTLAGRLSARYKGNLQYLVDIYKTRNDWMLEPFQHRGNEWVLEPIRNKKGELPWAGEYAGKWLDAASLSAAYTGNEQLSKYVGTFIAAMIATQDEDGYLGIDVPSKRGQKSEWDTWNIKYALTGLLTQYEVHHDKSSLHAAIRCGEWLINEFGMIPDSAHPFYSGPMDGGVNVNIVDQFARLYRFTGDRKFQEFASSVITHYPPIDQMRSTNKAPLWHAYNLMGILNGVVEFIIADHHLEELQWVEKVWEDLAGRHLYPTGSLGYNELLSESAPNDTPVEDGQPTRHHQETCATVEWLFFNVLLYQVTGRVRYIEKMEQTIYNALLGAQSTDGMKWMYFTPLRYEKRWFTGPTSCCYWSGPRGIARLPEWVYALDGEGIRVNLYETSEATLIVGGHTVAIKQSSLYPDRGKVTLLIEPEVTFSFKVQLRIPPGTKDTKIKLNGRRITTDSEVDGFFGIQRKWSEGDQIVMEFDIPVAVQHFLNAQYGILVRGPELLAVDQQDNTSLDLDQLVLREEVLLTSVDSVNGRRRYMGESHANNRPVKIIFTPYADCGGDGSRFRTAFPL